MKVHTLYTYLGSNGIVTTPIAIEGATGVKQYSLIADEGKFLTKDNKSFLEQVIIPEAELNDWKEVSGQN